MPPKSCSWAQIGIRRLAARIVTFVKFENMAPRSMCPMLTHRGVTSIETFVRQRTSSNSSIFTTIPYIGWLLLGRWLISLPLLLWFSLSIPLQRQHFRSSQLPPLTVCSKWSNSVFTITQSTGYVILFQSLFLWLFFPHWMHSNYHFRLCFP